MVKVRGDAMEWHSSTFLNIISKAYGNVHLAMYVQKNVNFKAILHIYLKPFRPLIDTVIVINNCYLHNLFYFQFRKHANSNTSHKGSPARKIYFAMRRPTLPYSLTISLRFQNNIDCKLNVLKYISSVI